MRSVECSSTVRVQESRTCTSAVYHQPAFHDDKFHKLQRSNVPSFENLSRCRKQISCIVTSSRDLSPNVNRHCHIAGAKTSFFPCKEEDKLLHPCKMLNQAITHASTTECSLVFLVLSYSNVSIRDQALSKHVRDALTTSYGSRIIGSISHT